MLIGVDSLASVKATFAAGVAVTNRWQEQCGCYEVAGCDQFWEVLAGRRLEVVRCNQSQQSQTQTENSANSSQQGL